MNESNSNPQYSDFLIFIEGFVSNVKNGNISSSEMYDISQFIKERLSSPDFVPLQSNLSLYEKDPEISKSIEYLFRGWWLTETIEGNKDLPKPKVCPYCMKDMDK